MQGRKEGKKNLGLFFSIHFSKNYIILPQNFHVMSETWIPDPNAVKF